MLFSIPALFVAAFVSLIIGFIWYNPKVFGTIWMKEAKIIMDEKPAPLKMFKLMALTFFASLLMSSVLSVIVIHQMGVFSSAAGDIPNFKPSYHAFMADYGNTFRTFKHGAFHGWLFGVFFILPLITVNALYESKSWKYIFITAGYWVCCLIVMGGIICAWH